MFCVSGPLLAEVNAAASVVLVFGMGVSNQRRRHLLLGCRTANVKMQRVRIELTTSGLWDLRATNCAIAAMTFEGSQQDQACLAAPTKDAHAGAVADVLQDSPWWVLPVLGFFILFHLCFAKTLHHR